MGVVPLFRLVVVHRLDPQAVRLLERGKELLDSLGRKPGDDDDLFDACGCEVHEHEVEDRAAVTQRRRVLGRSLRERTEPPAGACRKHDRLHALFQSGRMGRRFYHGASIR